MVISKLKISFIIILVIVFLGMLSLYFFYSPADYAIFPKCPFHSLTGLNCPGCGSQRAAHQILQGHIITGLRHNYLIGLLALVLGYKFLIFILNTYTNKTYNNLLHRSITTKIILVIILLFWVLRNINVFPFTELAP